VQAAVHAAVLELQALGDRSAVTVPAIASRAGVTPSTIYRRWGDIKQLLADVAVEQLRPETPPADVGSFDGDLRAWLEQYTEEMSSAPGRAMLRDVLGTPAFADAGRCMMFCTMQLDVLRERAVSRGESTVPNDVIIDRVLAPAMYRILFAPDPPSKAELNLWVDAALG
jgi:AcrR family transcriptional regulator